MSKVLHNLTFLKEFKLNQILKIKGIELERVGDAEDPLEGSNVTLICRTHVEREFASPPEWSYQLVRDTGETLKVINDTITNEGNSKLEKNRRIIRKFSLVYRYSDQQSIL
jgi:hypothetical protein